MAEPYLGQIMIVGFNFAPRGWAQCNGQLLSIAQNTALFSLLGTTYGGDGRVTFALPDVRSRVPIHVGQGPGLSNYSLGQLSGEETHTLISTEMPMHTHLQACHSGPANNQSPAGHVNASEPTGATATYSDQAVDATMNPQTIGIAGGSQPHNNIQPYLTLNFCIAMEGIFPPRD